MVHGQQTYGNRHTESSGWQIHTFFVKPRNTASKDKKEKRTEKYVVPTTGNATKRNRSKDSRLKGARKRHLKKTRHLHTESTSGATKTICQDTRHQHLYFRIRMFGMLKLVGLPYRLDKFTTIDSSACPRMSQTPSHKCLFQIAINLISSSALPCITSCMALRPATAS